MSPTRRAFLSNYTRSVGETVKLLCSMTRTYIHICNSVLSILDYFFDDRQWRCFICQAVCIRHFNLNWLYFTPQANLTKSLRRRLQHCLNNYGIINCDSHLVNILIECGNSLRGWRLLDKLGFDNRARNWTLINLTPRLTAPLLSRS